MIRSPSPWLVWWRRWLLAVLMPLTFFASGGLAATLPSNVAPQLGFDPPYQEIARYVDVNGKQVYVRAFQWLGEKAWGETVVAWIAEQLPVLERDIGIPLPYREIQVYETHISSDRASGTGGMGTLRIVRDTSEELMIHELAHLWLGYDFHERWVQEGFSDIMAFRVLHLVGRPTPLLRGRLGQYQRHCRSDLHLAQWQDGMNVCGYGKAAVFAALLYEVLGEQAVHTTLRQLYANALQGLSFQQQLLALYPDKKPDDIAKLFSGWVNPGPYYYGLPQL